MSVWLWLWIGWALYFLVVEGIALFNSRAGDTLSEHVWAFLGFSEGIRRPSGWTRLRRFLLLAFLAWLIVHLLTGGIF
ncbi:hypothetical protein ACQPZJ_01845 [Actinoplanes sp. CA-054009]